VRPRAEIHVAISPTKSFFAQVHYLAASIRQRGGALSHAPIIVTVGDDCDPFDIAHELPWARHYPVCFRWLPRHLYRQHSYYATAAQRYCYEFSAPLVVLLDADLVFRRDMDDLLDQVALQPALHAMLAYCSPWGNSGLLSIRGDEEWWRMSFQAAGLGEPPFVCQYPGYGVLFSEGARRCPPYFNQGVVVAPAPLIAAIGAGLFQEMEIANRTVETFYRVQVALCHTIARKQLPWRVLPMRYNYMVQLSQFEEVMPEEWEDVRIVHYSDHTEWFEKDRLMTMPGAMDRWLAQPSQNRVQADCRSLFRTIHEEVQRGKPFGWFRRRIDQISLKH